MTAAFVRTAVGMHGVDLLLLSFKQGMETEPLRRSNSRDVAEDGGFVVLDGSEGGGVEGEVGPRMQ